MNNKTRRLTRLENKSKAGAGLNYFWICNAGRYTLDGSDLNNLSEPEFNKWQESTGENDMIYIINRMP